MLTTVQRAVLAVGIVIASALGACAHQQQVTRTASCYVVTDAEGRCSDLENYENCRPCPEAVSNPLH